MKVLATAVGAGQVALSDTAKRIRGSCSWAGGDTEITHRDWFEVPALSVLRKSELVYFLIQIITGNLPNQISFFSTGVMQS